MALISVVINADTRNENSNAEHMFGGCVNDDFLVGGIVNKISFVEGFSKEIILHVDEHNEPSPNIVYQLSGMVDNIQFRKHTNEHLFNDNNYLRALQQAQGDYIMHFDQDTAAFAPNDEAIHRMIDLLEDYDYISYPSHWAPLPVHDESFDHVWCSTRFFLCKRETLDFPEISKCLYDYEYWCKTYPVNRKCHWLEHILGSISKYKGKGVYYPPINLYECAIFCWGNYKKGTLDQLNKMSYEEIKDFIYNHGGIQYPNNIYL